MEVELQTEAACLSLDRSTGLCPPQVWDLFLIYTKMQRMPVNMGFSLHVTLSDCEFMEVRAPFLWGTQGLHMVSCTCDWT